MNKKSLKLIALILSLSTFVCLLPLSATADDTLPSTGLIWDDEETIETLIEYHLNSLGDMNCDKKISVADAKEVLYRCTKIDILGYYGKADVNIDGKVSVADAKQILCFVAGVDGFRVKADLKVGEKYETYDATDRGARCWICNVTPENGLDVEKFLYDDPEKTPTDSASEHRYIFTATEPGVYEAVLKYENSETHKTEREIIYIFTVK